MRVMPAAAAVPLLLLLLLLTWLSARAINTDAELFDRTIATLDRFAMLENALNRDALLARAGMLRNYDPLVWELNALNDALGKLRKAAAADADQAAAIDRLAASVGRQEELVEQFKSDNALLQNSLAYFQLFSAHLSSSDGTGPLVPAVVALAAGMLRLTLDTSPTAALEVEGRLNRIAMLAAPSGEADSIQALLAHGRMLHDLLPATDKLLKALVAVPIKQDQKSLRVLVLRRQSASRASARDFRLLLYGTSLVLLGLLVHLVLRLRAGARALQRRAAFEHVLAGISMRFINTQPQDTDRHVDLALADLAECVGADRAYFLVSGPSKQTHTWCRRGIAFAPGWPDQVSALLARFRATAGGIIHIPRARRLPPGEDRDTLLATGLQGWACVSNTGGDGVSVVLGFEAVRQPCRITQPDLGLLPMALDTIANAVGRQLVERERARLETQLQQARRMETVGALASSIAHNFNNIVGAILGYAEIAEAQVASDSRPARTLDEIRRAGERARDLIDQILAFSRRRDVRRVPVSVKALIAETMSLLHASLPPGIELIVGEVPEAAIVSGEPGQLQQVILNLCNNAAQATDKAGRIDVETDMQEIARTQPLNHDDPAPGRYARIAVNDAGRGMDDAIMDRIFEPFFTTRPSGTGLGLATVREIVREHGGAMKVRSRPGIGSRFEVWLPCVVTTAPAAPQDAPAPPLGQGEAVLVVDDESPRLLRDEEILAALGYEPVGFTRASDALAACQAAPKRFDVLMVGHLEPAMSALELATALHRIAPDLPILLTTMSADEIGADALVAAGVFEVVRRPLSAIEMAAALKRCLAASGSLGRRATILAQLSNTAIAP